MHRPRRAGQAAHQLPQVVLAEPSPVAVASSGPLSCLHSPTQARSARAGQEDRPPDTPSITLRVCLIRPVRAVVRRPGLKRHAAGVANSSATPGT